VFIQLLLRDIRFDTETPMQNATLRALIEQVRGLLHDILNTNTNIDVECSKQGGAGVKQTFRNMDCKTQRGQRRRCLVPRIVLISAQSPNERTHLLYWPRRHTLPNIASQNYCSLYLCIYSPIYNVLFDSILEKPMRNATLRALIEQVAPIIHMTIKRM